VNDQALILLLRFREHYRIELADIDYCIKIRSEDIAKLNAKKAQVERSLAELEERMNKRSQGSD
jgi:hypothetical protein